MARKKFKLWHSLLGTAALLIVEGLVVGSLSGVATWMIVVGSIVGAVGNLYVATEVIEEVRSARHLLVLLSVVVAEFVVFFAFQYHFLLHLVPGSFPTLAQDPVSLLLNSVMVFVFNPFYMPADGIGRALLLINTLGSLGLVLFILQNIWQVRRG